jgi:hypothetical protein
MDLPIHCPQSLVRLVREPVEGEEGASRDLPATAPSLLPFRTLGGRELGSGPPTFLASDGEDGLLSAPCCEEEEELRRCTSGSQVVSGGASAAEPWLLNELLRATTTHGGGGWPSAARFMDDPLQCLSPTPCGGGGKGRWGLQASAWVGGLVLSRPACFDSYTPSTRRFALATASVLVSL